ncbi:MAG TPA: hypothetical protein VMC44_04260, partial [Geobacteraceae bacterium]|nr:hypothetical protein [Geobacteraceae bacterium]
MGGDIFQLNALHTAANNADLKGSSQERKPYGNYRRRLEKEKESLRLPEGILRRLLRISSDLNQPIS